MKLVLCLECSDIFSPGINCVKRCNCGYTVARWKDPAKGTLEVANRWGGEDYLRVLGLNNHWTREALNVGDVPRLECDERHKQINEGTSALADGYLFKTRNCPIIMVRCDGWQIIYNKDLLQELEWHGRDDCTLKDIENKLLDDSENHKWFCLAVLLNAKKGKRLTPIAEKSIKKVRGSEPLQKVFDELITKLQEPTTSGLVVLTEEDAALLRKELCIEQSEEEAKVEDGIQDS